MADMKSMMTKTGIKDVAIKCRNCGRSANASEFVLDYKSKMMVCPLCIKERNLRENVYKEINAKKQNFLMTKEAARQKVDETKKNIPGWDKDDEMLEKMYKFKMDNSVRVQRIDEQTVKYRCPSCSYVFKINTVTKNPSKCQFCGAPISKFR